MSEHSFLGTDMEMILKFHDDIFEIDIIGYYSQTI